MSMMRALLRRLCSLLESSTTTRGCWGGDVTGLGGCCWSRSSSASCGRNCRREATASALTMGEEEVFSDRSSVRSMLSWCICCCFWSKRRDALTAGLGGVPFFNRTLGPGGREGAGTDTFLLMLTLAVEGGEGWAGLVVFFGIGMKRGIGMGIGMKYGTGTKTVAGGSSGATGGGRWGGGGGGGGPTWSGPSLGGAGVSCGGSC